MPTCPPNRIVNYFLFTCAALETCTYRNMHDKTKYTSEACGASVDTFYLLTLRVKTYCGTAGVIVVGLVLNDDDVLRRVFLHNNDVRWPFDDSFPHHPRGFFSNHPNGRFFS